MIPVVIGLVVGGVTYLLTKGVSISNAAQDIDYKISVKNLRIHKVSLPFTIDTRFEIDIKLTNPSEESFTITHPDIIIKYQGTEIGRSTITNQTYTLKKRSELNINNIQFQIDLGLMKSELSSFISLIVSNWKIGKGISENLKTANQYLAKYKTEILKKLSTKVNLSINKVPISYEDTLAGGEALGKFLLGYAPVSAIDRPITAAPQFDKYFQVPQGKKTVIKRNANVIETVNLMIDIVNKDHKLLQEASHKIFKRPTIEQTAKNIFDWIYRHIKYDLEVGEQLRNPLTTYHLGQRLARKFHSENGYYSKDYSADCDDISIFVASILKNLGIPYLFRIADYSGGGYSHVYTLIPRKDKAPIIIDPVYHKYDAEKKYVKEKTFNMNKDELSGIDVYYLSGTNTSLGNIADDTYQYLIKSRYAISENPHKYEHIANPQMLVELYDYAIQYWNTDQRDRALAVLAQREEQLIEQGYIRQEGIAGLGKLKFFTKLKEFAKKQFKKLHKTGEVERTAIDTDKSNYANTGTSTAKYGAGTQNNFTATAKAFVSKHKTPIIVVTTIIAGGVTYALTNRKKNKSNGK